MSITSSPSSRVSGDSGSSANDSFMRVSGVRRSWLTPASISVRCCSDRCSRILMVWKAVAALRTSRVPPEKAKSGTSRPLPSASAATPRCSIGTSSRRMNQMARPNSTSDRPTWAST